MDIVDELKQKMLNATTPSWANRAIAEIQSLRQQLASKNNEPEWIKCSNKLPTRGVYVLVRVGAAQREFRVMKRTEYAQPERWVENSESGTIYDHFVTHWMELPKAPSEQN